jgi:KDO2-lipid IV(A) lauroyltransferase
VHVEPLERLLGGPLSTEPQRAAEQVNAAMEAVIRRCPQQYLWGYARYKAPRQT